MVDHPCQLPLSADVRSLFIIYKEHMTRFPYQNLDLYLGKPKVNLSISTLLETMSVRGGHCYQHSELMFAVLEHVGFQVERVASYVLLGKEYQEGMPLTHNILMVTIDDEMYLCDPGFAAASPRFPIKLNMLSTEEVTISEGSTYKLEVQDQYYQLHWMMKGSYLLMYRFERSNITGLAKPSDRETALEMCRNLYEGPGIIPIRDKYVKISLQTHDSTLDLYFADGSYTLRIFTKGRLTEQRSVDYTEFFHLVKEMCHLEFEAVEITKKPNIHS
eukprot:TRINITY_DN28881_c0_g1_i1.p1 TRINITY_DN28881_c0_g1~~TRINITY_DN28881_c0_g1_i1.p1  ORF type:complete len:274 (+),score=62.05 TRINITY_DN28881_c0_g1_i1:40-861(+)